MLAILLTENEEIELELLIKRELEEMRSNGRGKEHSPIVQHAIEERYNLLLKILLRFGPKSHNSSYVTELKKARNNFNKKC